MIARPQAEPAPHRGIAAEIELRSLHGELGCD
jgi:hypothetical protein